MAKCFACHSPDAELREADLRLGIRSSALEVLRPGDPFDRAVYSQGKLTSTNFGRDHHPGCITIWMAGGGIKGGMTYGGDRPPWKPVNAALVLMGFSTEGRLLKSGVLT